MSGKDQATGLPQIAALPMYDFPDLRAAHDTLWKAIAEHLVAHGVTDVPRQLTRDLGHRDVWRHPSLLLGQACEYPLAKSYAADLKLVATPRYSAPGCEESFCRSAIIVRAQDPVDTLAELRDRRCAVNELDSNSGMNLLRAAVAPFARDGRFFRSVRLSGSHRHSVEMVAADQADVAAIDCVSLAHIQRIDRATAARVRILCFSPRSPSLPFVTGRAASESTIRALRLSLVSVFADDALLPVRELLLLAGIDLAPDATLGRVRELERKAVRLQYRTLQ
jgi:ABC-type phosphate/phosphonate transport system substrate-binding protein